MCFVLAPLATLGRYQLHVLMLYNGKDTDPSVGAAMVQPGILQKENTPVLVDNPGWDNDCCLGSVFAMTRVR